MLVQVLLASSLRCFQQGTRLNIERCLQKLILMIDLPTPYFATAILCRVPEAKATFRKRSGSIDFREPNTAARVRGEKVEASILPSKIL